MPLTSPAADDALSLAAAQQFASRPTLREAVEHLLPTLLAEQFPGLEVDLAQLHLFVPHADGKGYRHSLLVDAVLDNLAQWQPLELASGELQGFLGYPPGTPLHLGGAPLDPAKIRALVKLPTRWVVAQYLVALLGYWQAPGAQGISRLRWLANSFQEALAPAARGTRPSARQLAQLLGQRTQHTRRQLFGDAAVSALLICTHLVSRQGSQRLLAPQLLLRQGEEVTWCQSNGHVQGYPSMAAFDQAYGASLEARYRLLEASWQLYEIEENPFLVMAEALLNQQLEEVQALALPSASSLELERKFATVTDVAACLAGNPGLMMPGRPRLQDAVPAWLREAGAADYYRYRLNWLELSLAQQQDAGQGFLHGIPSLRDYAAQQLRDAMLADYPDDAGYDPAEVVLTIKEPLGTVDGFGTTFSHTLPLVDAALENLTGLPKGSMSIAHSGGQLIMPWLTVDYVKALIRRVDIGASYPRLLETRLRSDQPQAAHRQALYSRQLKIQLVLLALEYKIKGEQGFTRDSLRAVTRALNPDSSTAVVRPLSFLSGDGAAPDAVANMFLFSVEGAPALVLYRPLFAPVLQAFADEAALFAALADDSALAGSVLTWMAPDARRVYGNGGFAQPHLGVLVDDPAAAPASGTVRLGTATVSGDRLAHFYQANVDVLLTLADHQSTSNTEDRWRMFKEGGWLLFNVVLPLVRGPAAVAGWLLQLVGSLEQDLQQLHHGNEQERAAALVDLLFNLGTAMLHGAGQVGQVPAVLGKVELAGAALRPPSDIPAPNLLPPRHLEPDLQTQDLARLATPLDFRWAGNRNVSNPALLALLQRLQVPPPEPLPAPVAQGPARGLFLVDGQLHVRLNRQWFRVQEEGEDFCLVDAVDAGQRGPWLRRDERGKWQLDLRARLKGGMPPKRNMTLNAKRDQLAAELVAHRDSLRLNDREVSRLQKEAMPLLQAFNELMLTASSLQLAYQRDRSLYNLQQLSKARQLAHQSQLLLEPKQLSYGDALKRHLGDWERSFVLTQEAERRGLIARSADYLSDLAVYYRGIAQTHLFLQSQLYERQKRLQLSDSWFNNAFAVTVPEPADTRLSLEQVMQHASDFTLQALNSAEAVERLLTEAQANTRLAKHWEEIHSHVRDIKVRLKLPGVAACRVGYLETLARTLLDTRIADVSERHYFRELLGSSDLFASALSHAELSINPEEFSVGERLQVLEGAMHNYSTARWATLYVGDLYPAGAGQDHLSAYLNILEELHASAEADLGKLLLDDDARPRAKPSASGGARRVIHTRRRQVLVGKVREPAAGEPSTIVDVEAPANANLVASFREHPGDEFVEIKTILAQPEHPAPAPGLVGLKKLRKDARALLARVAEQKRKQAGFMSSNHEPADIEFPLVALAWNIEEQAGKFARHAHLADADQAIVTQLREAAQGLKGEGKRIRLEMCRQQAPTALNLHYLWQQRQLRISREVERVAVLGQANDFLDEYKVVVSGGGTWYAHFHYSAMDQAAGAFDKGHLKLEAQRRLGYRAQLAAAQNNQQRLQIHRGNLDVNDTKGWFPF